ncbi:NAD(P)H-hydrate dehydratase [Aureibacillus halotolerans]|uniref:Bifunctional NAD(P)H-hydrate repair enzyme n=1 Tax=Aureibacillus halotolerans TaxID=1508390 RepID=A0A4V6PWE5_9BACI|nr:NAD(P)H-hydrate dehydratase [Aureibacillus halotolerans]TDQ36727.1 NAD(P)H-hydrate epimerase [Aureibacillus halotolerans]
MKIITVKDMYEADRWTMEEAGLDEIVLMENAGAALASSIQVGEGNGRVILAGKGNNGGDAIVMARRWAEQKIPFSLWLLCPPEKLRSAPRQHLNAYVAAGHSFTVLAPDTKELLAEELNVAHLIVDGMLGIGTKGAPREPYRTILQWANHSQAIRIAIDVPSGVSEDIHQGEVFKATRTITLQAPKTTAFHPRWTSFYGQVEVVDIGLPDKAFEKVEVRRQLWGQEQVRRTYPKRAPDAHKGTAGKACVFAGSFTMPGAAVLAGKAAIRGGAGLTTIVTPKSALPLIAPSLTEATYVAASDEDGHFSGELPALGSFDAITVGPGIGRRKGSALLVDQLLEAENVPLLLDADALYHLSEDVSRLKRRGSPTILTPHPGEMAQLCGVKVQDVQTERLNLSRRFCQEYGVFLVLKGPHTVVTTPSGEQFVNHSGNAALAKGGTGDVLTGVITAFMMSHGSVQAALCNAVWLHGKVAEVLVEEKHSLTDVTASDVIDGLPSVLRTVEK